jgi:hypothetical protein
MNAIHTPATAKLILCLSLSIIFHQSFAIVRGNKTFAKIASSAFIFGY